MTAHGFQLLKRTFFRYSKSPVGYQTIHSVANPAHFVGEGCCKPNKAVHLPVHLPVVLRVRYLTHMRGAQVYTHNQPTERVLL
jgi:hypothetical protein